MSESIERSQQSNITHENNTNSPENASFRRSENRTNGS